MGGGNNSLPGGRWAVARGVSSINLNLISFFRSGKGGAVDADLKSPCRGPLPGLFCGVRWMEAGRKAHMIQGDRATGNFIRSHTIL